MGNFICLHGRDLFGCELSATLAAEMPPVIEEMRNGREMRGSAMLEFRSSAAPSCHVACSRPHRMGNFKRSYNPESAIKYVHQVLYFDEDVHG